MPLTEEEKLVLRAQMQQRTDIMGRFDSLRMSYPESDRIPTWLPLYVLLKELGKPSLAEYLEDEVSPKSKIAEIVERCKEFAKLM